MLIFPPNSIQGTVNMDLISERQITFLVMTNDYCQPGSFVKAKGISQGQ